MGESRRPQLKELRNIYLLVGECCGLGADPAAWRHKLAERCCEIFSAQVAIIGEAKAPSELEPPFVQMIDHGWLDAGQRETYLRFMQEGRPEMNPMNAAMFANPGHLRTRRRVELVADADWYGSPFFAHFLKSVRLDDTLMSVHFGDQGVMQGISLMRRLGGTPFDVRRRRLLNLLHRELIRLLGSKLANFAHHSLFDLPPRLRQVLRCLLEGDSEKQVADRLAISRHTVHEHVKRLHKRLGTRTRAELLAQCYGFLAALQADIDPGIFREPPNGNLPEGPAEK